MADTQVSNPPFGSQSSNAQRMNEVRELVLESSKEHFSGFLQILPKKLLEFAEKPGVGDAALSFLKVQALLKSQNKTITQRFCGEISAAFDDLILQVRTTGHDWRESTLSLVSHEDMEEEVALAAIRRRAETEHSRQLWALGQRLSLLTGGKKIPEHQLPLSPAIFCSSLRRAIAGFEIPFDVKLIIFKLFEKTFILGLDDMYQHVNQQLLDSGLLPNLRFAISKEKNSQVRPSINRISSLDTGTIKQLLDKLNNSSRTSNNASVQRVGYNEQQLVEAARHLQQASSQAFEEFTSLHAIKPVDIAVARGQLINHLQKVVGSSSQPSLSGEDMKTIELVGMLFEYMLNDEQLPDVVKALLSHLHTPLIKVALVNRDFFDHENHPARLLMNNLADAGVKWVGNDGKGQYGIVETIRSTVRQVVDEFENDTRLFAKLLIEFSSYIKKVEIKVQMLEKRAAEKARGEDKLKQVKQRVNKEIKQRINDVELPSALLLLFLQPWSDYMAFLLLRYGDKSELWQQALNLVDDLLWGLNLDDTPDNRLAWRQNYTWVEATLAKGFETIGYNPGRASKLKSAIDKVYEFSHRNTRTSTPQELRQKLIKLADQRVGKSPDIESLGLPEKHLVEELTELKFGTWFEYKDGHREKLAWFNKSSLQFLFVDQSGRRTGMKDGAVLAKAMLDGELRVISTSEQPLVERTLKTIYTDLTSQVSTGGG